MAQASPADRDRPTPLPPNAVPAALRLAPQLPRGAGVRGCARRWAAQPSPVWRAVLLASVLGGTTAAWGADTDSAANVPGVVPGVVSGVAASSPAALAPDRPLVLQPSTALGPPPTGDQARQRPMILRAETLRVRPELDAVADGDVEFRRAGTVIRADHFRYDSPDDLASARGQVVVTRDGVRYSGPELQLQVQRFEGFFLQRTPSRVTTTWPRALARSSAPS